MGGSDIVNVVCTQCEIVIKSNSASISCSQCFSWLHKGCTELSTRDFNKYSTDWKKTKKHSWVCNTCKLRTQTLGEKRKSINNINVSVDDSIPSSVDVNHLHQRSGHPISQSFASPYQLANAHTSNGATGFDINSLMCNKNVQVKDTLVAISHLYNLILDQNNVIQKILSEMQVRNEEKTRLISLEGEVSDLREELRLLKSVNRFAPTCENNDVTEISMSSSNSESLYSEIQDRTLRSKNIIVHNIPESPSEFLEARISHDTGKLNDILTKLGISPGEFKSFRLGRSGNQPRPLKVIFQSSDMAKQCLNVRKKLIELNLPARICADMTVAQRNYIKLLHNELSERKAKGEGNLVIRYYQGTPKIVKLKENTNGAEMDSEIDNAPKNDTR